MNKITIQQPFNTFEATDLSSFHVGPHLVVRQRLAGTPRTLYRVMHGDQVAGQQLSYPTLGDCAGYVKNFDVERRAGRAKRVPSIIENAHGTLSERIVNLLKIESMDTPQLCGTMKCSTDALSPILNKLVRAMRISRKGEPGKYTYSAR